MNHYKLPDQILIQGLRQNIGQIDTTIISDPSGSGSASFEELKIKYSRSEDRLGILRHENLIQQVILSYDLGARRYTVTLKLKNQPDIQQNGPTLVLTFDAVVQAFGQLIERPTRSS